MSSITRRQFLAVVGAASIAGCRRPETPMAVTPATAVSLFDQTGSIIAGAEQRIVFAIIEDGDATDMTTPATVTVRHNGTDLATVDVSPEVTGPLPATELARVRSDQRYYPLRFTFDAPGIYDLAISVPGLTSHDLDLPVQVFRPGVSSIVQPGDAFPAFALPTSLDAAGENAICTRAPTPCGLHGVRPDELVESGQPFVFLVTSPGYCESTMCSPAIDTLISLAADYQQLPMVHAEVFRTAPGGETIDASARSDNRTTAMTALGLDFHPALFLVDDAGVVVARFDNAIGRTEIDAAIAELL